MTQYRDDVTIAFEQAFSDVDLDTPVEKVISRGSELRRRRRALAGGAVLAVAAAVAVAIPLSGPAGGNDHRPAASVNSTGSNPGVQVDLAAWSVHTNADGTVTITVRELSDPTGLRETLAKAGVTAVVSMHRSADVDTCPPQTDPRSDRELKQIIVPSATSTKPGITIRTDAIPKGARLGIDINQNVMHHVLVQFRVLHGTASPC